MPNLDIDTCPLCEGNVTRVRTVVPITTQGRTVEVQGEFSKCSDCEEIIYGPGELDAVLRKAAELVRSLDGLLVPGEIATLRRGLGLSQSAFEELLGVGAKTVGRWERGTVAQSAAADALLRLVRDVPGVTTYLCGLHGVAEPWSGLSGVAVENATTLWGPTGGKFGYGLFGYGQSGDAVLEHEAADTWRQDTVVSESPPQTVPALRLGRREMKPAAAA